MKQKAEINLKIWHTFSHLQQGAAGDENQLIVLAEKRVWAPTLFPTAASNNQHTRGLFLGRFVERKSVLRVS